MSQALSIPYADQDDFLAAAQALLPQGDAWPRDAEAILTQALNAAVGSLARVHARAADLTQREAVPFLSRDLLPAWEAEYGLPDPCTPLNSTIAQRQAAVLARMQSAGGQTEDYFIAVAKALGYDITITTFEPAQYGESHYGDLMYSDAYRFVWQVNALTAAAFPAQFGVSQYGDPYVAYSGEQLTCVLNRIKPAYSILIMNYGEG